MDAAHTALAQLVDRSRQLYTLPGVALRVLELTDNPQVDATELTKCIENDPALATKILRVVNSSLFGLAQRVSNLGQALALLGTKPLKLLVLGFSLPEPLFVDLAGDLLAAYWKHTLTRAVAARELCERLGRPAADELFLAGLLKDLGRLVLMQGLGKPYIDVLRQSQADPRQMRELERRLLGFDHLRLTSALLDQWRLPTSLVDAVALPDTTEECDDLSADRRAIAEILQTAERFAELLADGQAAALAEIVNGPGGRWFDRESLVSLCGAIERTVSQLADVLSVDLSHGVDHSAVLARVYAQLAGAAEAAVEDWLAPPRVSATAIQLAESEAAHALKLAVAEHGRTNSRCDAAATSGPATSHRPAPAGAHRKAVNGKTAAAVRPGNVDADLVERIASAAALCRQARRELSLLLASADGDDEPPSIGPPDANEARQLVEAELTEADPAGLGPLTLPDGRWALVLPGYDRREAGDVGYQLLRQTRAWSAAGVPASLSVGISTAEVPAKNFRPLDLIRSAERCLGTAQLSGGNCVKSIESC